jgi:hypothetical protein
MWTGIAYLSNSGTAFGKVTNSSVRNTSNNVSCSQPGNAIYAEGGSSNPLNVQGNTVRGFSGNGISFASNQVGNDPHQCVCRRDDRDCIELPWSGREGYGQQCERGRIGHHIDLSRQRDGADQYDKRNRYGSNSQ